MQAHIPSTIRTHHVNLKKKKKSKKERKKKVNNQDQIERTIFAMIDNHFGITPACLPFADYTSHKLSGNMVFGIDSRPSLYTLT